MSLIDSDMFYWRQKKCFSMIDKVKNVTTLIIYSSALQKTPKPKTIYIIHLMQWRKKSVIWQPILADGTKCTFSIFWQSYVVYVDKKKKKKKKTQLWHFYRMPQGSEIRVKQQSTLRPRRAEHDKQKNHFYGFKPNNTLHVSYSNSSIGSWGSPRTLQQGSVTSLCTCENAALAAAGPPGAPRKATEIF